VDEGVGKRVNRLQVSFSDVEKADLLARARVDGRSLADYVYRLVVAPGPCACGKHDE
jgi:hypothetical protein